MAKRRRLEDLYVRGRELSIDDGSNDPVVVWVQKMNPLEHEKAIRKAGAAKAKQLLAVRDHSSEEWQEAYVDVAEFTTREQLIDYIISDEIVQFQEAKEAELSYSEEWQKDNYLGGLRDAWEDADNPLSAVYARDPEDEEARRVFLELKRFADQVEEEVGPETERLRRDFENMSEEDLRDKALEKVIELRAGLAWLREYRTCEVLYGVREVDDHRKYYFTHRDQVDALASQVFVQLSTAYNELMVAVAEGKDSAKTPSSSPSSEQPSAAAT